MTLKTTNMLKAVKKYHYKKKKKHCNIRVGTEMFK